MIGEVHYNVEDAQTWLLDSGATFQITVNRSPDGNQINVADSRSGEILSLEDSMIGEVHYSVQDAQTIILDSSVTFHVTLNIEWFSNYSARMSGTI